MVIISLVASIQLSWHCRISIQILQRRPLMAPLCHKNRITSARKVCQVSFSAQNYKKKCEYTLTHTLKMGAEYTKEVVKDIKNMYAYIYI